MRGKYLATGLLALMATGQARAEVLALDCARGPVSNPAVYHIWIDMQKSAGTTQWWTGKLESCPMQITATSINWSVGDASGSMNYDLDRTTGALQITYGGGISGGGVDQCIKGSTPFPATKF